MRKVSARMAALVAVTLVAGCVNIGGGSKAPTDLYGLGVSPLAAGVGVSAAPAQALVLAEPEVTRALATTRVAVAQEDGAVSYLKGGAWIDRPARLLRDRLADSLRAKRLVVVDGDESPSGAARLSGQLSGFGYDEASHAAVVRYDALLRRRDGTLAQRRFEVSVPVAKPRVSLVVAALAQASGKLAQELADWVG